MFLPALLGIGAGAGSILGIGSTLLTAAGTLAGGMATAQADKYNARLQESQAQIAETQAAAKATEVSRKSKARVSDAAAAILQSGFDLGGSFDDYLKATATSGEMDALSALYEGNVRATGYRNSAALSRYESKQTRLASYIGAGSRILGGVADVYRNTTRNAIAAW
jgi:hypothetical protein